MGGMEEIRKDICKAEEEAKLAAEVVQELAKLGILFPCPPGYEEDCEFDRSELRKWVGCFKYLPRYGKPERYGWEKIWVPVARVNQEESGVTVTWYHEIEYPDRLLASLIKKYHEKNRGVSELAQELPGKVEA